MTDPHRLMVYKLSQTLRKEDCVNLAELYDLPPAFLDELEKPGPGGTLIRALESRMKFAKDEKILKNFYDTLLTMNLNKAADLIAQTYPGVKGGASSGSASSAPSGETSEGGRVVMGPAADQASNSTKGGKVLSPPSD